MVARKPHRHGVAAALLAVTVAVVSSVAGCSGGASMSSATPENRTKTTASVPTTATTPTTRATSGPTPAPAARPTRSGVTFGSALYGLSTGALGRALDDVVALHARWIRVDLSWAAIQPVSRTDFQWSEVDAVVTAARARRLDVLGLLTYTPAWARAGGCTSFACPPRSAADFADFASVAARRYVPRGVLSYQVWNEPNIATFWRSPDAVSYQRVLASTSTALRTVSGRIRVLFGGLAFVGDAAAARRTGDIDASRFVRWACAGRPCDVDAVGYDPYTYPRLPSDPGAPLNAWQRLVNPAAGSTNLRAALRASGLGSTPVWITAYGAPTTYTGAPSAAKKILVSEARQSAILVDGARVAGENRSFVGAYFVNTRADSAALGPVAGHFGIVRTDGTRKPAFAALATALRP